MGLLTMNPTIYAVVFSVAFFVWVWRRSLPRPIPGNIPYEKRVLNRPFGHLYDAILEENPLDLFKSQNAKLQSPIFQLFIEPFGMPLVGIVDDREAHDILARRSREFDRARFFADLFLAIAPHNQVVMPTNDQWHSNRRLMADTMSPTFLTKSAAPQAQAAFATFIDLWRKRAMLSNSLPFDGERDIDLALLDAITAIAFGSSSHATEVERDFVVSSSTATSEEVVEGERVTRFERTTPPSEHTAIEALAHSTQLAADSPIGSTYHKFGLTWFPKLRAAQKIRKKILERQVRVAYEKFSNPEAAGDDIKSATDVIVQRELTMAKKEGRKPDLTSPIIDDELFGFLVAGYDTTATTVKWGVKFLTTHPEVQAKLRKELHAAYADTYAQGGLPSIEDSIQRRPPYLDAVIEEILRLGNPGVAPIRTTTQDTTIFGHFVPKGVDVVMLNVGPSYTEPAYHVDESTRSKTSQESKNTAYTGNWDPATLGQFMPERWLSAKDNGELEFNPRAGAQHTFGGGLRGCFGRKLAYVMMRLLFAMIVWEFELLPMSEELSTMASKILLTHTPKKCYVRLRNIGQGA